MYRKVYLVYGVILWIWETIKEISVIFLWSKTTRNEKRKNQKGDNNEKTCDFNACVLICYDRMF